MKYVKYKVFFKILGKFSQILATEILNLTLFKISIANICKNPPKISKNALYFKEMTLKTFAKVVRIREWESSKHQKLPI